MSASADRRQTTLFWLGLAAAALLLFSRSPGHLLAPELWAEDGKIWVHDAYSYGWRSLFWPLVGYLQTISRLGGLLGVMLPFTAIPLFFALIALAAQLAPAALMLSRRGVGLLPSLPVRLLLVAYYIAQPNSSEVYVNLTNAMWHLALVAFLLVVLPKPKTRFGTGLDIAVLILAGLSGPLVLFIAPIAWWHLAENRALPGRGKRLAYAIVLSLCALAQGIIVIAQAGRHRGTAGQLGATAGRLFHILADQIVLGGIIGGKTVESLLSAAWWQSTWPAALCCASTAALGAVAFLRGPPAFRQLVVLAALLMGGALKSPMITKTMPQWGPMQAPGIGDRYYIIPMLAWFAALLVLASLSKPALLRWLGRGLICLCLIGVIGDWRYKDYVRSGYQEAARTFDQAAPGTAVTFPENPLPWNFRLTKR